MQSSLRDMDESSGAGVEDIMPQEARQSALHYEERFILAMVNVQRRAALWEGDKFDNRERAAGLLRSNFDRVMVAQDPQGLTLASLKCEGAWVFQRHNNRLQECCEIVRSFGSRCRRSPAGSTSTDASTADLAFTDWIRSDQNFLIAGRPEIMGAPGGRMRASAV